MLYDSLAGPAARRAAEIGVCDAVRRVELVADSGWVSVRTLSDENGRDCPRLLDSSVRSTVAATASPKSNTRASTRPVHPYCGEADTHLGHSDRRRLAPCFLICSTAQEPISRRCVIKATVRGVPTFLAGPAGCGQGPPAGWRSTAAAVGLAANGGETVVRPGEPAAWAVHQHGADPASLGQSDQPRGEPRPRSTHAERIAQVFDTMASEPVLTPASSASQRACRVGVVGGRRLPNWCPTFGIRLVLMADSAVFISAHQD